MSQIDLLYELKMMWLSKYRSCNAISQQKRSVKDGAHETVSCQTTTEHINSGKRRSEQ